MLQSVNLNSHKPEYWDEAVCDLVKRDRILRRIIPQYSDVWLAQPGDPFITLARALIGHQSSTTAADTAWKRFISGCGKSPTPNAVLHLAEEDSTLAGLPKRKAEYIIDLAGHFADKKVKPSSWGDMEDESRVRAVHHSRYRPLDGRDVPNFPFAAGGRPSTG